MNKAEALDAIINTGQTIRNHTLLFAGTKERKASKVWCIESENELKAALLNEIPNVVHQFKAATDFIINTDNFAPLREMQNIDADANALLETANTNKDLLGNDYFNNYLPNIWAIKANIRRMKRALMAFQGTGIQRSGAEPLTLPSGTNIQEHGEKPTEQPSQPHGTEQQGDKGKQAEQKQMPHFDSDKTDEELKRIFDGLKQGGLIDDKSQLSDWLYICKGTEGEASRNKIKWTAKNTRTRMPSKKSLLDLLVTMGFKEKDIKANINECFNVDGATKKYTSQDYNNYKDWSKDIQSEYHEQLKGIIKGQQQQK